MVSLRPTSNPNRVPAGRRERLVARAAAALVAASVVLGAGLGSVEAQINTTPKEMEGVQIVEKLGDTLPLDLTFRDEAGQAVKLQQYFDGERPVLLNLVYYNCPMLCGLVLNGLVDGLKEVDYTPGDEFVVVTVSIDPREGADLAAAKEKSILEAYGRPEAAEGWHFLTGERDQIKALADAIGFGYRFDPDRMEYAHGAAIFFASPTGKLTRYLFGIQFPPKQLRLALVEAGEGKIGSAVDRFLLRCYMYNPDSKQYAFYIWGAMRLGGLLTIIVVGGFLFVFWRRERRQNYGAI